MKLARIGIIGLGFVGSAVKHGFDIEKNELYLCDPKLEDSLSIKELILACVDYIFVCVPTPISNVVTADAPHGYADPTILMNVLEEIEVHVTATRNPIVIVKSTIPPDFWDWVGGDAPGDIPDMNLVYNPEFLKESTPDQDFEYPPCVVLGGDADITDIVENLYKFSSKVTCSKYIHTSLEVASFHKYTVNCWLATKVAFFNQLNDLMTEFGIESEYDGLTEALVNDDRIGASHMTVPGPDGKHGFGGSCFPKDTRAFISFARMIGSNQTLLEEAVRYNEIVRNKTDADNDIQQE